jgi:uncharacterized membrane protein YfcA
VTADPVGSSIVLALAIAAAGGVIRGITGFGGAMVMIPPLTLLFEPRLVVPPVLMLETAAIASMLRPALPLASGRLLVPLGVAACATVPLGSAVLASADPLLLRRATAAIVVAFALLLLLGGRLRSRPRTGPSVLLGALSGALVGATGVGAPPVIVYLLASAEPAAVTRANLAIYVALISAAALVAAAARGLLGAWHIGAALAMAPLFFGGLALGSRLFPRLSDTRFRQFALCVLVAVSAGILLA